MVDRSLEWVYSVDAARGAVKACHTEGLRSRIFNIGMGEIYSSRELVDMVKRLVPGARLKTGSPPKASNLAPRETEAPCDITSSREELGYEPDYKMEPAVKDFLEFLKRR
ncbi:MAG: hypothetical protein U1D67_10940 [Dehalococcoidia bacterium]|nr:hypothetical protein [Dehalococcoidia bacterium]MDZ4247616.1 hypothetical protein [Dehalococcoidia bacterium]